VFGSSHHRRTASNAREAAHVVADQGWDKGRNRLTRPLVPFRDLEKIVKLKIEQGVASPHVKQREFGGMNLLDHRVCHRSELEECESSRAQWAVKA